MANGGIIGPVVTPPNVQTQSAPGVWTLQEAQEYIRQGLWPRRYDPLYNYTTLLLSGNGANNATNSSFLDSSSNNFTVTRNGNTTQGTFSPFSQTGWGNYFDGTGDYLSVADNSVLRLGTSNFTIECWVNRAANGTAHSILAKGGASTGWLLEVTSGNVLQFTHTTTTITTSLPVYAGNWVHVAAVREGTGSNQFKLYINGTLAQTATMATDFTQTDTLYIGANRSAATTMNGYISNVRIVNGTALYTAQFTPSTTPLTTTSQGATAAQVELLTCQSNRFLDNSGNGFTVTPAGNSAVVAFSPFNATQPWDPLTYGGSGYFDGSGDYLGFPTSQQILSATGDLTIECFVYPTSLSSDIFVYTQTNGGASSGRFNLSVLTSGALYFQIGGSSYTGTSGVVKINQWNFISATRTGSSVSFYVNGASAGSGTVAGTIDTGSSIIAINRAADGTVSTIPIYYGSFRISNIVRSNLTNIPTAPYISDTNTSLLLNFTNIGITDATSKNALETVGNAKISTAQSKFGGSSMYFDGTGDYLVGPSNSLFNFGSSDFTMEGWFNQTGLSNSYPGIMSNPITFSAGAWSVLGSHASSGVRKLQFYCYNYSASAPLLLGTTTLSDNTWYYFAVTRSGSTFRLFLNGTIEATTTFAGSMTSADNGIAIGTNQVTSGYPFQGYLQDIRVTRGYARYTENFAVPDSAFATLGNTPPSVDPYFDYTTLLLPGSGSNNATNNSFLDSSANNFTITRNGNTTQGTFSPFSQTGWGNYFDGSGDSLQIASNNALAFGTGDYTIETWLYLTDTTGSFKYVFDARTGNQAIAYTLNGDLNWQLGTPFATISGISAYQNTWVHFAAARSSGTLKVFLNGVQQFSGSDTSNWVNSTLFLGSRYTSVEFLLGYISNFRVVKGTAVYTSNFTPPTAPLTAISGTSLLTCQSNRFIDNSTNNFTITKNGDTRVVAFSPFNPSASWSAATYGGGGYFDGSGDYLSVADNAAFDFGTGDYTVELWIYRNNTTGDMAVLDGRSGSTGYLLYLNASNKLIWYVNAGVITGSTTIGSSQWYHIAISRVGTAVKLFVNGVEDGSATNSTSTDSTGLAIGAKNTASSIVDFNGYISNVRLLKGTGYSTITVPTAPLTAITNTSLLLNFTNAGILDATSKNDLETVADAKISTAQSVWTAYGSSMSFDGTGDWLTVIDQPVLRLGTGNFTVEMWLYLNATGAARGLVGKGDASNGWLVSLNSSNNVVFTYGTSTITSTGTISASVWTHITVVREGTSTNQTKIYINGTNDGTGTVSTDFTQTNTMYVGANRTGGDALNGYLQDLRITRWARYTSAFQPPSAPLALR